MEPIKIQTGLQYLLLIFILTCKSISSLPMSDAQRSQSVRLVFSDATLSDWQANNKTDLLKDVLANYTTSYCSINPTKCGFDAAQTNETFRQADVHVSSNFPVVKQNNLEVIFFIQTSSRNDQSSIIIPYETLIHILTRRKEDLNSLFGANTMHSGDLNDEREQTTKEGSKTLNKIMIPVAFFLVIFVALLAWILHRAKKKELEREERVLLRRYAKTREQDTQNPSYCTNNNDVEMNQSSELSQNTAVVVHSAARPQRRHKKTSVENGSDNWQQEGDDVTASDVTVSDVTDVKGAKERVPANGRENPSGCSIARDNEGFSEDMQGSNVKSDEVKISDSDSAVELNTSSSPATVSPTIK